MHNLTTQILAGYVLLWALVQAEPLDPLDHAEDEIIWTEQWMALTQLNLSARCSLMAVLNPHFRPRCGRFGHPPAASSSFG
jgi:hypothetical protein